MNEQEQVGFSYGAIAKTIEEQAIEQGYTLGKDADEIETCRVAITQLRFGIHTPDSIHGKLIERLHKKVIKSLKPIKSEV